MMKKALLMMTAALMLSFTFAACGSKSSKDKDKDKDEDIKELFMDEGDKAVKAYEELVEKYGDAFKENDLAKLAEFAQEAMRLGEKFHDVELSNEQKKKIEEITAKFTKFMK